MDVTYSELAPSRVTTELVFGIFTEIRLIVSAAFALKDKDTNASENISKNAQMRFPIRHPFCPRRGHENFAKENGLANIWNQVLDKGIELEAGV
ncbi:MAG: hypothetical protein LBC41_11490 [Clostridiales bacterium]|nr:hypothetical protein [Clostridiales bacterium]MDR2751274.1 hypothetical protein [Clostridiales bacterium]